MPRSAIPLVLFACSSSAVNTPPPPRSTPAAESATAELAGQYVARRTIIVPCDDTEGCELEVEERLTIGAAGDQGLPVEIELTRANASRCAISRTLVRTGDRWESRSEECTIGLVPGGDLRLSVQGCRESCGQESSLEIAFTRAPAETAEPVDCDELCTEIGACWEEVHDGDYRGGGDCAAGCQQLSASDRRAFATCLAAAGDCPETLACE